MALSFLYLAFRALLGMLVRSRRGVDVKDLELLVLRHGLFCGTPRAAEPPGRRRSKRDVVVLLGGRRLDGGRVDGRVAVAVRGGEELDVPDDLVTEALRAVGDVPLAEVRPAGDRDRPA